MVSLGRRSTLLSLAGLIAVIALALALFIPQYDCKAGTGLARDIPPPAGSPNGWICVSGDVSYVPDNRMPLKVGIALGGLVLAGLLVLVAARSAGRGSLATKSTTPD